ncbi:MAG: primosomal protein N' [Gammaproteobacteria bacterium]|nr:primosomal protein N' [Gammaproteobacteria bacterium]
MNLPRFLGVAVFAPLRQGFDYSCPADLSAIPQVGCRVLVPFSRGRRVGVITVVKQHSEHPLNKIKPIIELIDSVPLITADQLRLAEWAARYYHYPLGEIVQALLPQTARGLAAFAHAVKQEWFITAAGRDVWVSGGARGARQIAVLKHAADEPITPATLLLFAFDARRVVRELVAKAWLELRFSEVSVEPSIWINHDNFLTLNPAQATAFLSISAAPDRYRTHLLHGVTGSGKTEVYLHLVRSILERGAQALVLIPEIGLTEQIVARFTARFGSQVAVAHSKLSNRARALVWQRCNQGQPTVLLGTRSAVWTPLPKLKLIVVDEEHDASYKQQEGLRYSARDVAVVRARLANIPIVLGSATPSFESMANCVRDKYSYIELPVRAGGAVPPSFQVLDIRGLPLTGGLSEPLRHAITSCVVRGEQALLFLNRRGYAPVVLCHRCGWIANCERCDARLVLHQAAGRLRCHHCGTDRSMHAPFPQHTCGDLSDYVALGVGTEQIEEVFTEIFPTYRILRIDSDTTARKGEMAAAFAKINAGEIDLLVGTQMVAKGHDFNRVTLVGIIDADGRLFANDFRAEERFAQLVLQVAGRAGRAALRGQVLIQTHFPDHPVFAFLSAGRYAEFVKYGLRERESAGLPPSRVLALLRAEATGRALPLEFLTAVVARLRPQLPRGVTLDGPIPAAMEKRVGKFRANVLISAREPKSLSVSLERALEIIPHLPGAAKVKWSLDVDAQDTF